MKKIDIKHVINKLEPDKGMEYRLSKKIMAKQDNKFVFRPSVSIAAGLVMVICVGILGYNFSEKKPDTTPQITNSKGGIYVPKIQLPKNISAAADMLGFIVYQGKIYEQVRRKISPESAKNLLGEKLGTTKGNIDEWSKQSEYAVEFASSIRKQDVYSVRGYDKSFRIMTYGNIDGNSLSQFYECFNGITVNTGEDIFNKLKIQNNIRTVKYESFNSWNNNNGQYSNITNLDVINNFASELKNAIPYTQESRSSLFDEGETNQKLVYITLNDGSEIQLRLFKDGYIYYDNCHIFFKMENQVFELLWNQLK